MSDGAYGKFLESLGAVLRLAAITILALVALCAWDTHRVLLQLRLTAQKATDTEIVVGGAARDLELALRDEQKASGAQIAATAATLKQAQQDLADVDKAALSLNSALESVHSTMLSLNGAIEQNSGALVAIEGQARKDLEDFDVDEHGLAETMSSANGAVSAAGKLLADPTLVDDLAQVHTGLVHLSATSAHVDAGTADLAEAIHRETRPASFAVKTAGWIVNSAAKFGSIFAGFIK